MLASAHCSEGLWGRDKYIRCGVGGRHGQPTCALVLCFLRENAGKTAFRVCRCYVGAAAGAVRVCRRYYSERCPLLLGECLRRSWGMPPGPCAISKTGLGQGTATRHTYKCR
jgi:hypothetical protein